MKDAYGYVLCQRLGETWRNRISAPGVPDAVRAYRVRWNPRMCLRSEFALTRSAGIFGETGDYPTISAHHTTAMSEPIDPHVIVVATAESVQSDGPPLIGLYADCTISGLTYMVM